MTLFHPKIASLKSRKRGFALVIALGLMAFIILLLLSLTAFVRVETESARINIARMEARQNALMGLQVAIGELQKAAGPDQRVTVSTEMFDNTPDISVVDGVSTRDYTGVFRAHSTGQPLEAFRALQNTPAAAIKWLASAEDILTDPVADDPSAFSTETLSIAKVYRAETNTLDDIIVGKVPIIDGAGNFAWWVGDEGIKAKFNTIDPGIGLTQTEAPFVSQKTALMQMRQSNFSHVSDAAGIDPDFTTLVTGGDLSKLSYLQDVDFFATKWGDWALPKDPSNATRRANVNPDVTVFSRGIPVDVTQGRLKEDLTVYLETGKGLSGTDHIVRAPGDSYLTGPDYIGPDFGVNRGNPTTDNLPRFGLLRSWNDLGKQIGTGGAVVNQPQSNTVHGLHPTVMRAGFAFSVGRIGDPVQDPDNPSNMLVDFRVLVMPRVTLMNPYNFTLPPAEYLFEVTLPREIILHWRTNTAGRPVNPKATGQAHHVLLDFLGDGVIQPDSYAWQGDRAWMRVVLNTGELAPDGIRPGETRNFVPERTNDPLSNSIYADQSASAYSAGDFTNYMIPSEDADSDRSLNQFFVVGPVITKSVPKDKAFFPIDGRDDLVYDVRYLVNQSSNTLENSLSWRLSRLGGALLSTKDPTKTTTGGLQSYDRVDAVRGLAYIESENFNRIYRLDPSPVKPPTSFIFFTAMTDYWSAAAGSGQSMHGGDRRNAIRNPRGGTLRAGFDNSNWGIQSHRVSVHNKDVFHEFWDRRWRREINEFFLPGTVEGFTSDSNQANSSSGVTGTRYTWFDFPRRFGPITSLGQLQHANLNPFAFGSAYQVGFSRAPYHVQRQNLLESANTSLPNERIDLPFMVNTSLWDRFYLSTIPQLASFSPNAANPPVLANNRHIMTPLDGGNFPSNSELRDSSQGFEQSAAYIQIDGAFNINSVSVDAWEAVLLGAAGKTIQTEQSGQLNAATDESFVAFPRFPDPVYGVSDNEAFDSLSAADRKQHAGLFVTDRNEIRLLAEAIVAEIKRRGPFLSLADFINRRQIADSNDLNIDYQGLMGTLDAAIMRASQNPGVLNYQQIFGRIDTRRTTQHLDPNNASANEVLDYAVGAEAGFGVPFGHTNTALESNSANLTQGDILQALGSQLSARSDTFVIRSYGDVVDPISGKVISRARCEAVLQRMAKPVDVLDSVIAPTGEFGRRFVVVAFRWLDEDY
jgi:hypothetical protein